MIGSAARLGSFLRGLDPKMAGVFVPFAMRHPKYLKSFPRFIKSWKEAKKLREEAKDRGLVVPPFLILSITSRCNLACAGCYAAATGTLNNRPHMKAGEWKRIIREASDAGVFGFVIAGGEPFLFPGLIDMCRDFSDRLFMIFTNGTVLKDSDMEKIRKSTNILVFVSVEGSEEVTDGRRGEGVHGRAMESIVRLAGAGVITGISVTITRKNFRYWMDEGNMEMFIGKGIRACAFIEHIPTKPGDRGLMLSREERKSFRSRVIEYREGKPIYIVHSPGDEDFFGGCVSAGRGFAHVTPEGDLTACPISDVATHNLTKSSILDALKSGLFREIRDNEHLLENEGTPCALFAHPSEVDEIAKRVGAYRTSWVS